MKKGLTCLIVFISLISIDSAFSYFSYSDIDFGPSLEVFDESNKIINIEQPFDKSTNLIFKLTLTNSHDYWICWESWSYSLGIRHEGDDKNYNLQQTLKGKNCLAPNEKMGAWIPFEDYNNLKDEVRLGIWTLEPSASLSTNANCYSKEDITKDVCGGGPSLSFKGNVKKFSVIKQEPSTHPTRDKIIQISKNIWVLIAGGVIFLAALLSIIAFFRKK